jgi:hypothetical protein
MTAIATTSPPMLIRSLRRPSAENSLPGWHMAVAGVLQPGWRTCRDSIASATCS